MKKRTFCIALAVLMVFAFSACGGNGNSSSSGGNEGADVAGEEATTDDAHPDWIEMNLTAATFLPEGNPTNACFTNLQAKLDKYMPGKITMDVYYASTLLNEADMYDGVLAGTADIGIVGIALNVSRFPVSQLFNYPGFSFKGSGVAAEAHWNWIQAEKPAEYDDIVVLMTQATGPMALVTKDKVAKNEDVAGRQYRAVGIVGETVAAWGGTPVTIEDSEVYEAMRSGLLQGSYSFYGGSAKTKLDEVAEYVMLSPLSNMAFIFGMNKERFAEMPADQQDAFMLAAVETMEDYTWWFNEENLTTDSDVVAFSKKMKHTIIGPDDPEFAGFYDKGKVVQDAYVKSLDEQGLDGTGQLAIMQAFVDEANAKITWEEYLDFYAPLTYAD